MDIILYVAVFAFLGVFIYFADRHWGAPFYRRCWNLWHKMPLNEDSELGFIVGRKNRRRVFPALALTLVSWFVLSYYIHDPVELFLKSPLIFSGFMIGFLLTGLAMRETKTRTFVDQVCNTMDDIESGKVDLKKVAETAFDTGVVHLKDVASTVSKKVGEGVAGIRTEKPLSPSEPLPSSEIKDENAKPAMTLEQHLENMRRRREG